MIGKKVFDLIKIPYYFRFLKFPLIHKKRIMNLKGCLIFGLAFFLSAALFSKNIYIKFDPACMDRLEYRLNGNLAGNGLISYSLKANDAERIVMEIGVESIKQVKRLPRGTKTCGKVKVDDLLANSINSGKDKVYIVRPVGKNYIVSPVHLATYMKDSPNQFYLRGNELDMVYALSDIGIMENNLSSRTSDTKVFFTGSEKRDCKEVYELKKIPIETCKPYTDMIFAPGIGIIQEKTGVNQADAETNILQLVKINNIPLDDYLANLCNPNAADLAVKYEPKPEPASEESPVFQPATTSRPVVEKPNIPAKGEVIFPVDYQPPAPEYQPAGSELVYEYDQVQKPLETFRPRSVNCKELSYPGVHIVQSSQTLFGIARQYSVTVKQLRTWNKLDNEDLIKPCASLYVLPPNEVHQTVESTKKEQAAEVIYNNTPPANTIPVEASQDVNSISTEAAQSDILFPKSGNPNVKAAANPTNDVCNKLAYDGVHIVQKGETLFSISQKYDLTVKQIQQWNKLGDKSKITPCSSLYVQSPEVVIAKANNPQPTTNEETYTIPDSEISPSYTNAPGNANVNVGTTPKGGTEVLSTNGKMWNSGIEYHVVQKGETLMSLAKMYGFTLERFRDINGLGDNNIIRIGQVLRTGNCLCPADAVGPTDANTYRGGSIRGNNNSNASNNTNSSVGNTGTISSGNESVVSENKGDNLTEKGNARERASELDPMPIPYDYETENVLNNSKKTDGTISYRNGRKVHTVQENETMASIANKYNIPIEVLRKLNKMEKNEIVIPEMRIYLE